MFEQPDRAYVAGQSAVTQLGRAACCYVKSDADLCSGQDPLTNPGKIQLTGASGFGSNGHR